MSSAESSSQPPSATAPVRQERSFSGFLPALGAFIERLAANPVFYFIAGLLLVIDGGYLGGNAIALKPDAQWGSRAGLCTAGGLCFVAAALLRRERRTGESRNP